jgi:hypothetical protein
MIIIVSISSPLKMFYYVEYGSALPMGYILIFDDTGTIPYSITTNNGSVEFDWAGLSYCATGTLPVLRHEMKMKLQRNIRDREIHP